MTTRITRRAATAITAALTAAAAVLAACTASRPAPEPAPDCDLGDVRQYDRDCGYWLGRTFHYWEWVNTTTGSTAPAGWVAPRLPTGATHTRPSGRVTTTVHRAPATTTTTTTTTTTRATKTSSRPTSAQRTLRATTPSASR